MPIINWNERYQAQEFAYGKTPNEFFKKWIAEFEPGSILMPADGEGRNGVYAAQLGWQVTSFDQSEEAQKKALKLARESEVTLNYQVGNFSVLEFEEKAYDAIGLIYAHFAADMKIEVHQKLHRYLRPGGVIILEAFSKNHLPYREKNPGVGGPTDRGILYSTEEIHRDFGTYEKLLLQEKVIDLQEGKYHQGTGSVTRFVGRKPAR